ncbi:MAG: tetratricopeptide repeat protein [Fibromonadales bacterium]|nr:tetratricopeptide repeat protein [Fibromonadales bacterium]
MRFSKFIPVIAALFMACSSSNSKVEIIANEALKLAKADSLRLDSISLHQEFLSKRIDLLDSFSTALPLATANENQLQIALLREEVIFLRKFLENQDKVPLINPSRTQMPTAPSALPLEYEQAQYLFSQKNYEAAATMFEKVTVLYPQSDWADDAWYWAGESQMALGNFSQAISAFQKVFFYTQSIKQADAQFQIGICFLRMGNREQAENALRKVQDFYPKSPRALQAQSELKKLK